MTEGVPKTVYFPVEVFEAMERMRKEERRTRSNFLAKLIMEAWMKSYPLISANRHEFMEKEVEGEG